MALLAASGLSCTSSSETSFDPCSEIRCGIHQTCISISAKHSCVCEPGYRASSSTDSSCVLIRTDGGYSDAHTISDAAELYPDANSVDAGDLPPCELPYADGQRHSDLSYGTIDERQNLDILETTATGPNPAIVWIHGGGWKQGRKSPPVFGEFTRRGYTVIPIEYRLSDYDWPATLLDVKAAIRWIRANAQVYKIDPDRITVMGSSAGGHLASFLGTSAGVSDFDDPSLGNMNVSSTVNLVVNFYGPISLIHMDEDTEVNQCPKSSLCHLCEGSPESLLLDCTPPDCPQRAAQTSPVTHVDGNEPPFLTVHGVEDCTVPTPQGQRLHDALVSVNSSSTLILAENAGHNVRECLANGVEDQVIDFVESHMRSCRHIRNESMRPADAQLNECLYENCGSLAVKCEDMPICVRLEQCFQQCFADSTQQNCVNFCLRQVSCDQDPNLPCISDDNKIEVVEETHYPLFQCGRNAGCYPRP